MYYGKNDEINSLIMYKLMEACEQNAKETYLILTDMLWRKGKERTHQGAWV